MKLWIVLVSIKGGYKYHSFHTEEGRAREWAACVQHGGEDTSVLCLVEGDVEDLRELLERSK